MRTGAAVGPAGGPYRLRGELDAGRAGAGRWFEYGTSARYGEATPRRDVAAGAGRIAAEVQLPPLIAGRDLH